MARRSGPALYELLKSSRPDAEGATGLPRASGIASGRLSTDGARLDPERLRVAVILVIALLMVIAAYMVGSSRGQRAGREALLAERTEEARLTEEARPASARVPSENPPAAPQGATSEAGVLTARAPLPPSAPGEDPREPGLNYFVLASTLEENAAKVVAFCRARGLDAYVVRDHNGRLREVTVLPGFREADRGTPAFRQLEEHVREVGRQFRASGPGNTDFGDRYLKQFRK